MQEMLKLEWVLNVTRGIEDAEDLYEKIESVILQEEGLKSESSVDWNQVTRYVFPDLVLMFIKTPFRNEKKFNDHVRYVVFPRTGQVLDLHAERIVVLQSDSYQAGAELGELVNQMSSHISKIEGSRRGEAMKHLRALHRVLGLTQ